MGNFRKIDDPGILSRHSGGRLILYLKINGSINLLDCLPLVQELIRYGCIFKVTHLLTILAVDDKNNTV